MLHARFGPARSYPYAWRLPALARDGGRDARLRAALALGLTLHAMGRFAEVLANLPDADVRPLADVAEPTADLLDLRARCLWLQDETDAALSLAEASWSAQPRSLRRLHARLSFLQLADDPEAVLAIVPWYREAAHAALSLADQAWSALFQHWAHARLGRDGDPAPVHAALSRLREIAPVDAARGEALHAEAAYHASTAWSLTWLDQALEQGERFGQHHLKARLLSYKARALAANGVLGESSRFLKLARETAERQGAWRYLRDMAP